MLSLLAMLIALSQISDQTLLQSALNPNPGLSSYIAAAELVARTHPLPLKRTFTGTAYYEAPTRKIVFNNVSGLLSRFQSLTTTVPTYKEAQDQYRIALPADSGGSSTFTLVPRKTGGRVTSLVVTVDDQSALVSRAVYHYNDGSLLSFDEHYQDDDGFHLVASIDVAAHFPGYSIDATIRFTDYHTNVPVPEAVFNGH